MGFSVFIIVMFWFLTVSATQHLLPTSSSASCLAWDDRRIIRIVFLSSQKKICMTQPILPRKLPLETNCVKKPISFCRADTKRLKRQFLEWNSFLANSKLVRTPCSCWLVARISFFWAFPTSLLLNCIYLCQSLHFRHGIEGCRFYVQKGAEKLDWIMKSPFLGLAYKEAYKVINVTSPFALELRLIKSW